jgi:hypothetical protein
MNNTEYKKNLKNWLDNMVEEFGLDECRNMIIESLKTNFFNEDGSVKKHNEKSLNKVMNQILKTK